jgi:hypothetical protein
MSTAYTEYGATMEREAGRLIGSGRHADVFDLGDGTVLRRYRTGQDSTAEARVMTHVRARGFPAPRVVRADGPEMVLERVDGMSMLDRLARRPHQLPRLARMLADLHDALHAIPPPAGIDRPFGDGNATLHLDLQPANVVLARSGPVVLDWGWAAAGPPDAETAHAWLELATSEVPGSAVEKVAALVGRSLFVRAFLSRFDRAALRRRVPAVAAYRLARRELTERERVEILRFERKWAIA